MLVLVEDSNPSVKCCELSVLTGLGTGLVLLVLVSKRQCVNKVLRQLIAVSLPVCLFVSGIPSTSPRAGYT